MKSTADRYREAGMPPPRGEVYVPAKRVLRRSALQILADHSLPERVHDPATDGPVLPDLPATAYGPDSVPLDTPDANTTEETS